MSVGSDIAKRFMGNKIAMKLLSRSCAWEFNTAGWSATVGLQNQGTGLFITGGPWPDCRGSFVPKLNPIQFMKAAKIMGVTRIAAMVSPSLVLGCGRTWKGSSAKFFYIVPQHLAIAIRTCIYPVILLAQATTEVPARILERSAAHASADIKTAIPLLALIGIPVVLPILLVSKQNDSSGTQQIT